MRDARASLLSLFVAGVALVAAPAAARAESPTDAALDVGVVTEVPLMVGGQVTAEFPYGVLLQGDLGVMPGPYADAIGAMVDVVGANAAVITPLLHAAFDGSLVAGISAGWRPLRRHGLELLGGYTLVSLGGTTDAGTVIEAASGYRLPAYARDASVTLHSTLHNVHASIGWRWVFVDHLVLRASLGYVQTLGTSSHVDVPVVTAMDPNATADMAAVNRAVNRSLDGLYRQYVRTPLLGVSIAYRF